MVVNLEFIRTIITAEEVYLLEPHSPAVKPFVEQLMIQLPLQSTLQIESGEPSAEEGLPEQLPFEFRVLEIALDVVCNYLENNVGDLEQKVRPVLEQLTKTISTSSLELVRSVKSHLTRLSAHVQKVITYLDMCLFRCSVSLLSPSIGSWEVIRVLCFFCR